MDVGLVCNRCDTLNPMASLTCTACGTSLSLGTPRKTEPPGEAPRTTGARTSMPGAAPVAGVLNGPAAAERRSSSMPAPAVASAQEPASARACGQCGATVQPGFRFCGNCGARMPDPRGAERKTMFFGAMQAARAKLVLIKGDGLDGISFTLAGQDHVAGRIEGPLLFHDDPFLSPRHANFYYRDGKLHVHDEASANGVYVRILVPTPLRSGDTFLVGEQVLRVESTPPETAGLGPDGEGTFVFASPRRASRFRLLQLLRGGEVGLIHRASGDAVTLGREENDINFPDDPFISGRHAQVSITSNGFVLQDLGSKNGTFLRITQDTLLSHGDYVFMGQQLLRVEVV